MVALDVPAPVYGYDRPRLCTPTLDGPTLGTDIAALAEAIDVPLLPWQERVAHAAHVIDADGRWRHSTAGVVVARQNGKTHLLRMRILTGLFVWGERLIVATAQNREIALETFRAVVETIDAHPWLSAEVRTIRRTNGQEEVVLHSGARYKIVAPTPGGARGLSADLVVLDEAREHRTIDAYAALVYTTQARPNPQVWLTSNAGDAHSIVLNRLRDQAQRAIADPGSDDSIGYWEYSAEPGARLDDLEAWRNANPALGHLVQPSTLAARVKSDPPDVVRTELLCCWVDTMDSPWPPDAWSSARGEVELDRDLQTFLAVDVTPDRRDAALVAVQPSGDELRTVLLDTWHADGALDDLTVAGDVAEQARQLGARIVAFDRYTGASIAARLASAGIPVGDVSGPRFTQACDELLSAMVSGRLVHAGQETLTDHVLACARKPAADGGWRIVRQRSAGPVCAAVALTMALHHAANRPAEPIIEFG